MKAILPLLGLAGAALLFAGCGHDTTANPPAASPAASATATETASAPVAAATTPATTASAGAAPAADPAAAVPLAEGGPAPDFDVHASDGAQLSLASLKGKSVVVYFYPKDETPGCTTEACSFRDAWKSLSKMGVVLIGVSGDTDQSHRDFADHHQLPFHLVSDADGKLASAFGVPFKGGYAARQSFVIGPDGKLKKIYRHVDVNLHAAQIANDVKP